MKSMLHTLALVLALAACGGHKSGPMNGPDEGSPDAGSDAGSGPGFPAVPRLIAPLSMGTVTQQRPTLRWVLDGGSGRAVVDLCRDRACTQPIATPLQLADDGLSAVPVQALPAGWVYWRVRVASGSQVATSRTWQFRVGRSSASAPVDTSRPEVLDVNGDGHADFLVGAPEISAVHLYLGSATAGATDWNGASPPARLELLSLAPPNNKFGASVASVGDVNGDGYGDFTVACPGCGEAYLYFGSAAPRPDDWNGLAPVNRVTLIGQGAGPGVERLGAKVAGVGDVDGDGYADFLVSGGISLSYETIGAAVLFLGSATASGADWNTETSPRRISLTAPEETIFDSYGFAIAGAGDVNGDGHSDFAVTDLALQTAYIYLGSAAPGSAWTGEAAAARIDLRMPGVSFGVSLAAAGDVNGDGYADLLIGDAGPGTAVGGAHLYLGATTVSASDWNDAASTARVDLTSPQAPYAEYGHTLASAGDVNSDGYGDFLVGAAGAGAVHLYLGGAAAGASDWNGAAARRIDLATPAGSERFGTAVTGAGDVNGDGYDDFLVGADAAGDYEAPGAAHLYFGSGTMNEPHWTGAAPAMRCDLAGPDGPGAGFGASVAAMDPTEHEGTRRHHSQHLQNSLSLTLRNHPRWRIAWSSI